MSTTLELIYNELGILPTHLAANKLPRHEQPPLEHLEVVDIDFEGKPFLLISPAAVAWREITAAAAVDRVSLQPFSGFRSYLHQKRLIAGLLQKDRLLESILTHIAIPGFSEHHSGRAVDIHTQNSNVLEEAFEQTEAFAWLTKNAKFFGFQLSYPRQNTVGIIYEPWHWFFVGDL